MHLELFKMFEAVGEEDCEEVVISEADVAKTGGSGNVGESARPKAINLTS